MKPENRDKLLKLVKDMQTAALGTLDNGAPYVSLVPYAISNNPAGFLLHISSLARHTQHIRSDPRVSLMIHEPEEPNRNPQTLARLSISGNAVRIPPDSSGYEAAAATYLERHPKAALSFQLADFALYDIKPRAIRFVAGLAEAYDVDPEWLFGLI